MSFSKGLPNSDIRKALAKLCTKKRIILSGTPFQNNFGELRSIMRLLLSPNDEDMVLLNPLTLDKRDMRGRGLGIRVEGPLLGKSLAAARVFGLPVARAPALLIGRYC